MPRGIWTYKKRRGMETIVTNTRLRTEVICDLPVKFHMRPHPDWGPVDFTSLCCNPTE